MIRLITHRVLVKLEDVTEVDDTYRRARAAGIELQLDKREKDAVEYATVIDVGPTAFVDYGADPTVIKKGDKIAIVKYSGMSVKDSDGTVYRVLNDADVVAVIE